MRPDLIAPMDDDTEAAQWIEICAFDALEPDDVVRFDHGEHTYAIYRTADARVFATDGLCTHARAHLSDGFMSGVVIECPKHNGRFDITNGKALGAPAIVDLQCHRVRVVAGKVELLVTGAS